MFSPHNAQWVFVCGYQSMPGDVLRVSSFTSPTAGVSNHLAELPGMQAFVLAQQHHTPQTEYQIDFYFLFKKNRCNSEGWNKSLQIACLTGFLT